VRFCAVSVEVAVKITVPAVVLAVVLSHSLSSLAAEPVKKKSPASTTAPASTSRPASTAASKTARSPKPEPNFVSKPWFEKGVKAVQVNYPGAGFRYMTSDQTAWDFRAQFADKITIAGLRLHRHFQRSSPRLSLYWGAETDFVKFRGDDSKGTGFILGPFLGGEYRMERNISFQMDVGPMWVSLKDKDTAASDSGVELVVNFGINFYFGRPK
jgi:hypothetical protein